MRAPVDARLPRRKVPTATRVGDPGRDTDAYQDLPFGDPWPTATATTIRPGLRAVRAFNG